MNTALIYILITKEPHEGILNKFEASKGKPAVK